MKKKEAFKFEFESYSSIKDLLVEDQGLLNSAVEAATGAYAPYSKFRVGAAVLLSNKTIVRGSNQENAAYPSGLCAERVALFSAAANYPKETMNSLAIYSPDLKSGEEVFSPCGACRQVMSEYEIKQFADIRILIMNSNGGIWLIDRAQSLLPFAFRFPKLK